MDSTHMASPQSLFENLLDPSAQPGERPRVSTPHRTADVRPVSALAELELDESIDRVCLEIPPGWGLDDLVAVNPFLGYTNYRFTEASALLQDRLGVDILPTWSFFRRAWQAGDFDRADLRAALEDSLSSSAPPTAQELQDLVDRLEADEPDVSNERKSSTRSIAARLDEVRGSRLVPAIVANISTFCASRYDRGVARWQNPARSGDLYRDWLAHVSHDLSMDVRGAPGFRRWARGLPSDPREARTKLLEPLGLQGEELERYASCLLGEVFGWACFLRQLAWTQAHDDVGELPSLFTIRLAYDLGMRALHRGTHPEAAHRPSLPPFDVRTEQTDRALRAVLSRAHERSFSRTLQARLQLPPEDTQTRHRPSVQAVFCIDVRSERFRRHLESTSASVETAGFAGFFAMPIEVVDPQSDRKQANCPPLLNPAHQVRVTRRGSAWGRGFGRVKGLLADFKRSAMSCFSFVEVLGLAYIAPMLLPRRATRLRERHDIELALDSIDFEDRVTLAANMLNNLGLQRPLARILLLCGHESRVDNNPQAAGLACGACAGHSGEINARLGARLLNDPQIRSALQDRGWSLPEDLLAVAGVHDTATDEVRLVEFEDVPSSHQEDLRVLQDQLHLAGAKTRAERSGTLPWTHEGVCETLEAFRRRASSWAEVRPEWGLADNAAFIAARRARTRGADLEGRVFLHEYDQETDPDGSVLTLILTAPVVVASWINLQYYASSVAPHRYGSQTKTIHNVVGGVGVIAGNEGDLAMGLAEQSVHDGTTSRHAPLRLQVFVEADPERIDAVLAEHESIRSLVERQWLVLHALSRNSCVVLRHQPGRGWVREPAPTSTPSSMNQ